MKETSVALRQECSVLKKLRENFWSRELSIYADTEVTYCTAKKKLPFEFVISSLKYE